MSVLQSNPFANIRFTRVVLKLGATASLSVRLPVNQSICLIHCLPALPPIELVSHQPAVSQFVGLWCQHSPCYSVVSLSVLIVSELEVLSMEEGNEEKVFSIESVSGIPKGDTTHLQRLGNWFK